MRINHSPMKALPFPYAIDLSGLEALNSEEKLGDMAII